MAKIIELDDFVRPLPRLLAFSEHLWLDYDREADVLYLSFRKPQQANDSELEDNVVYHYRNGELVGVTIIGFQKHLPENVGAQQSNCLTIGIAMGLALGVSNGAAMDQRRKDR